MVSLVRPQKESYYVAGDCVICRDKTHEASFEEKGVRRNHGKLSLGSSGRVRS